MDRESAIVEIKRACNVISLELMKIHPAVPPLADKPTQEEIYKALYDLTKAVEIIKKKVIRLGMEEQKDL
ncbi:MAG: hypothetical protein AB1813_07150 [Verrucomicrobiota bacterium]|jgi:hypothetical protein